MTIPQILIYSLAGALFIFEFYFLMTRKSDHSFAKLTGIAGLFFKAMFMAVIILLTVDGNKDDAKRATEMQGTSVYSRGAILKRNVDYIVDQNGDVWEKRATGRGR
jgi:hypothetical protein